LAWQAAQWSAQCSSPARTAASVRATGLARVRYSAGIASPSAVPASAVSMRPGVARALRPVVRI
jgi:hypothetical protein